MIRNLITKITEKMGLVKEEKNVSDVRKELSAELKTNSVTPVLVSGEFCGVLLTCADLEEWEKKRLRDFVQRNPRAAISEILDKIDK